MSAAQVSSTVAEDVSATDAPTSPMRLLCVGVLALGLGLGAARWLEQGGQRAVSGFVQVRTTFVTAERRCRILHHQQPIGERVTIGDPLVSFADAELEQRVLTAQQHVETLVRELEQAEATAKLELARSEQSLDDRICQIQLQAADYRQSQQESELRRSLLADRLAGHQTAMWDTGESLLKSFVLNEPWPRSERLQTALQLESCAHQSTLLTTNIEICETRLASLRSWKSTLPTQIRESCGVSLTSLRLEQAQQELQRLTSQQESLVVMSPAVGQVGVFSSRPGDVLEPGDPIVELLDDSQRYLAAEVPSTRIHEFKPGRTVTLMFPGQERRQGRVSRVAPQAQPRTGADRNADPLVSVDIEQAGRLWPTVPIGTKIEVLPDQPQ